MTMRAPDIWRVIGSYSQAIWNINECPQRQSFPMRPKTRSAQSSLRRNECIRIFRPSENRFGGDRRQLDCHRIGARKMGIGRMEHNSRLTFKRDSITLQLHLQTVP